MRLLALALPLLLGCSPAQQQAEGAAAYKLEPVIFGTCGLVSTSFDALDPAAAPVVTIACTAVEDIDGAIARLQAKGITQVRIICAPLKEGGP